MGRRKKVNYKNELKKLLIAIILIILFYFAEKYHVFEYLDQLIASTGLANVVNTTQTSTVATSAPVRENAQILTSVSEQIQIQNDKLNIIFFDVGQADCQLIISDGKTMLIDAGNSNDGEKIVNGIKALGITRLDYVIGTHVHEDHMGGMSYIIDSFDIGTFYLPYDSKTTTSCYKRLLKSLTKKEISINEAVLGDKFLVGKAECEIMSVDNTEPENINTSSIVIEMTYDTQKYLFMGDAESSNEKLRTWNDVDVLKVGHHGSNTSSSTEFLTQTLPEISIISVGKDNSYGLPKDKIIDRLNKIKTNIYRTDEDGTLQLISDGKTNEIIKIDISFDGN